jgi:hypothetical protein
MSTTKLYGACLQQREGNNGVRMIILKTKQTTILLVRNLTIPTHRPPLVDEFNANFCG